MALLGKIFGALRSAAKSIFGHKDTAPKGNNTASEHIEASNDPKTIENQEQHEIKHQAANPIFPFRDIKLVKRDGSTVIEADGRTYTLFQFSKEFGIKFSTLYGRVQKGWDIKEIINAPRDVKRDYTKSPPVKAKLWEWNGEKHTVAEWAKIYGIKRAMMRMRLTTYGSPERNTNKLEAYKKRRARRFNWNGETHTAKEWAAIYKVHVRTMQGRLKAHNSPEPVRQRTYKTVAKQYEWNGVSHTAEEWAEKTKQSVRTVKKHFMENGTPYTTFKKNSGHFKEKSYTWNGETKRSSEWADEYNCTVNAIHKRFRKNGSPEDTCGRRKARYFTFNGETHTYKEWGDKYGISADRMYKRIKRHNSPLPPEDTKPLPPQPLYPKRETVLVPDEDSSDHDLYWCDGECKTIAEWASEFGIPKRLVKANFIEYGTPVRPQYDCSDIVQYDAYGETEEDIDEILRDIDKNKKPSCTEKRESIKEWLHRISEESDDGRPLREILGIPKPKWDCIANFQGEDNL